MTILKKSLSDADNYAFLELSEELKRIGKLYPKEAFRIDTIKLDTHKCLKNHSESFKVEKFISRCLGDLVLDKVENSKTIECIICPKCYIESHIESVN